MPSALNRDAGVKNGVSPHEGEKKRRNPRDDRSKHPKVENLQNGAQSPSSSEIPSSSLGLEQGSQHQECVKMLVPPY
ncbi:hypothetical protein Tco_0769528 [Tanacetum coccineum]|uniref:Uncharacterized protein n=1 Tax=Tanacetum coccineum TaxID=301880 RepID=A0ABQ4ZD31_9ASTR